MRIRYNGKENIWCIDLEYPEIEIYIKAENIMQVREAFIERMTWLFDATVREQLKD
jgi:hypothetical protein